MSDSLIRPVPGPGDPPQRGGCALDAPGRGAPRRWLLLVAGYGLFGIGLVGIALPLLPTTVFWIGAVACLLRSDPAMARYILAWPNVGPAIAAYRDHRTISRRGKRCISLALVLSAMVLGAVASDMPVVLGTALAALALVALFIWRHREPT